MTLKEMIGNLFNIILIKITSGMIIHNERDYEDIDDLEEFQNTTSIAYLCLVIGGVLIGLGI